MEHLLSCLSAPYEAVRLPLIVLVVLSADELQWGNLLCFIVFLLPSLVFFWTIILLFPFSFSQPVLQTQDKTLNDLLFLSFFSFLRFSFLNKKKDMISEPEGYGVLSKSQTWVYDIFLQVFISGDKEIIILKSVYTWDIEK